VVGGQKKNTPLIMQYRGWPGREDVKGINNYIVGHWGRGQGDWNRVLNGGGKKNKTVRRSGKRRQESKTKAKSGGF